MINNEHGCGEQHISEAERLLESIKQLMENDSEDLTGALSAMTEDGTLDIFSKKQLKAAIALSPIVLSMDERAPLAHENSDHVAYFYELAFLAEHDAITRSSDWIEDRYGMDAAADYERFIYKLEAAQ